MTTLGYSRTQTPARYPQSSSNKRRAALLPLSLMQNLSMSGDTQEEAFRNVRGLIVDIF